MNQENTKKHSREILYIWSSINSNSIDEYSGGIRGISVSEQNSKIKLLHTLFSQPTCSDNCTLKTHEQVSIGNAHIVEAKNVG